MTRAARWTCQVGLVVLALALPWFMVVRDEEADEVAPAQKGDVEEAAPRVWVFSADAGDREQAAMAGVLAYDAASDCFYIEHTGEAIVWPAGTRGTATSEGPGVITPDGAVARVGDVIEGGGGHHSGGEAGRWGIAPECATDQITVFQFPDLEVRPVP